MKGLAEILSSRAKAEIFALLFGWEPNELHLREIKRRSGLAIGTIQQELGKLTKLDLVRARRDGNRLYYQANRLNPLYSDIHSLVLKTSGVVPLLKKALEDNQQIQYAFIFGSVAREEEKAESDIDLIVIGDIGLRKLISLITPIAEKVGREINPHIYSESELKKRLQKRDHFVTSVLQSAKIFVIGSEDELKRLAK